MSNDQATSEPETGVTETSKASKPMGFWKTWSMTVGIMIGSGVFLLPATLAPYGGVSFLGWVFTSLGAILLALAMARLVPHTHRPGGPYAFAYEAFGPFVGFATAWGYWLSIVFGVTAIAVAFVGYVTVFLPGLGDSSLGQGVLAAAVIGFVGWINARGVGVGATFQLVTTLLKILPLLFVIGLGFTQGSIDNLPPFNPTDLPFTEALAATALATMWAFIGIEAAAIPSDDVDNPSRTIPLALVTGTTSVALIYIASTAAVMLLLPMDRLASSTAPFAEAVAIIGPFGPPLIALGALIATLGALNGMVMLLGQVPMAVGQDGLAPKVLAKRNINGAPGNAIIFSAILSALLVGLNFGEGLLEVFYFLITMSTLGVLLPYALSALAQIKLDWKQAKAWTLLGLVATGYCIIAMAGSGTQALAWGVVLLAAGVPVYIYSRLTNK